MVYPPAFNRTSVELKRTHASTVVDEKVTFNRTSVELKHDYAVTVVKVAGTFNRTSVELKRLLHFFCFLRFQLLIEPVWN